MLKTSWHKEDDAFWSFLCTELTTTPVAVGTVQPPKNRSNQKVIVNYVRSKQKPIRTAKIMPMQECNITVFRAVS